MSFLLAYGYKAMVPVELGAGSLRRDNFDVEQNMILQQRELDFFKEKQRNVQILVVVYHRRTARYFNSMVKTRIFQEGNLILRRVLHNKEALDPS